MERASRTVLLPSYTPFLRGNLPSWKIRPRFPGQVPRVEIWAVSEESGRFDAKMTPVRRILLGIVGLLLCAAAVYGYIGGRRERTFRQAVARGEAALARDDTFAA